MEEKIRAGLGQAQVTEHRLLLNEAETQANALVEYLKAGGAVHEIAVAGGHRPRGATIGGLAVVGNRGDNPPAIGPVVWCPEVAEGLSPGEARATVKLRGG